MDAATTPGPFAVATLLAALAAFAGVPIAQAQRIDVLLVDDSHGIIDAATPYRAALDSFGLRHETWHVRERKEPTREDLGSVRTVIWLNGANRRTPGPDAGPGERALSAWLEDGGRLLLSSDSMPFSSEFAPLLERYFGVAGAGQIDGRLDTVRGVGEFSGLGPYVLACPPRIGNFPVGLRLGGAKPLLQWGRGGELAGVVRETDRYTTAFFSTPFECLRDRGARGALLGAVMERFGLEVDRGGRGDDPLEPNDDPSAATPAPIGLPGIVIAQTHVLDAAGDVEWLRFIADPRAPVRFSVRRERGSDPVAVEVLDENFELRQRAVLDADVGSIAAVSGDGLEGVSYLRLQVADANTPLRSSRVGEDSEKTDNVVTVSGEKQAVYSAYVVGHVVTAEDGAGLPNADVFLSFANTRITTCAPPTLSSVAPGNVGFFELGCNIDVDANLEAVKEGFLPGVVEVTLVPNPSLADDAVSVALASNADTDGDGTPNARDDDDDGDGLPDAYEEQFDALDPLVPDADADPDGDGFSNRDEYLEKTDPEDPNSNARARMKAVAIIIQMMLDD